MKAGARANGGIDTVFFHVTKACNLRCQYCYFSAARRQPDELSTDEIQRLWPDVTRLRPRKLVFTGGEPLLRADLQGLVLAFAEADASHAIQRCLNTNGHLLTRAFVRGVKSCLVVATSTPR